MDCPVADFFHRYGKRAILLLALIGLYRVSDIVAGVISNVFYDNMGFSKEEIAYAVKSFGIVMSIAGGFVGGLLAQKYKIMSMMMLGAIATAATNLLFILLALRGHDVPLMYLAVGIDNLAGGFASTVFVVFLSGPDQHPLHRRAIRAAVVADDAVAQNSGRLFGRNGQPVGLSRLLPAHRADGRAHPAAGIFDQPLYHQAFVLNTSVVF